MKGNPGQEPGMQELFDLEDRNRDRQSNAQRRQTPGTGDRGRVLDKLN